MEKILIEKLKGKKRLIKKIKKVWKQKCFEKKVVNGETWTVIKEPPKAYKRHYVKTVAWVED